MPKNYWLSLSFANLVYLRAWADLIPSNPYNAFFRKTLAGYPLYFAVAADVLVLSLLTFLVISLAPKLPGWLQRVLPILPITMVAFAIRSISTSDSLRSGLALGALLVVVVGLTLWFSSRAIRLLSGVAVAAAPCLAITFLGMPFYLSRQTPLPLDPPLAQRLPGSPPVRVLWILFDELDERLTFSDRAAGTFLPNLDVLASRSFMATRALAVQTGRRHVIDMSTYEAVPALLYGKFILGAGHKAAATMHIQFAADDSLTSGPGGSTTLGAGDSVFARMRAQGRNSALAGWYLPYCRVFNPQLTDCYWDVRYLQRYSASADFPHAAVDETRMLFETSVFSPFGPALVDARHKGEYDALMTAGKRYAADPSIGLAFIHLNVPHAPYFYDAKVGARAGYNDALRWVDRAVGDILASVRAAGLDGKTAIILTSDHPFRFSAAQDPHVPYIVHLPGDDTEVVWEQEFSAVKTADLAVAIASGEVKSSAEVADFVSRRNSRR